MPISWYRTRYDKPCLGKIYNEFGDKCSEQCPLTSLCVVLAMGKNWNEGVGSHDK